MKTSAFRAAFYLYHSLYLVINLTFPSDICSWKISTRTLFWRVWLVNMLKHNAQCSKSVSDSFWIIVLVAHHEPPLNWNKTECIRMSTHISAYTRLNVFFLGIWVLWTEYQILLKLNVLRTFWKIDPSNSFFSSIQTIFGVFTDVYTFAFPIFVCLVLLCQYAKHMRLRFHSNLYE